MGLELEMAWTIKRYNTNMDLELDLELTTPPTSSKVGHRWDWSQRWSGPYIKVKKLKPKYGSGSGSQSRVDSPKLTSFGTHMVIKTLDGSSCKKCIINASATYILHTHEKV